MALIPESGGGDFEIVDAGMHKARCIRIIDRGTHFFQAVYEGVPTEGWKHEVMIMFELPETKMKTSENEGQPFSVCLFARLSLHKKSTLRPFLESWRGKEFTDEEAKSFDILNLLEATAYVNVIHKIEGDNTYANIKAIMPLKSSECPDRINDIVSFSLSDFDQAVFDSLSEKMQEKIKESREYKEIMYPGNNNDAQKLESNGFIELYNALPKKSFDEVMKLCSQTMGRADFDSWFEDNDYPAGVDSIIIPELQTKVSKELMDLCGKREKTVADIEEDEIPF